MLRRSLLLVAGLGLAACSDNELDLGIFVVSTEVAVDPQDFLGDVACRPEAGAMQSYVLTVATFDNVDDLDTFEKECDATVFPIGSSLPTPCSHVAGFRNLIVPGALYIGEIDGYDLPADALEPYGNPSSGARQMIVAETGEPIEPRWHTQCGLVKSQDTEVCPGTMALDSTRVFLRSCDPLVDASMSPTRVALRPSAVLGSDPCATARSFTAVDEAGVLPAALAVPCDAPEVVWDAVAGQEYDFYVTADVGGVAKGARCFAVARLGETVGASCEPLTASGGARIDLGGLVDGGEPTCPDGDFYDLYLAGDLLNPVPLPCGAVATVQPIDPGIAVIDVTVHDIAGMPWGDGAGCAADVEPGKLVDAICLP
jgi:hypothetical protein